MGDEAEKVTVPLLYHMEKMMEAERRRTDDNVLSERRRADDNKSATKEAIAIALAAKGTDRASYQWVIGMVISAAIGAAALLYAIFKR